MFSSLVVFYLAVLPVYGSINHMQRLCLHEYATAVRRLASRLEPAHEP